MSDNTKNRNNDSEYEDVCYICRRPESTAGKMIHIPNNICICKDCMQKTFDSMEKCVAECICCRNGSPGNIYKNNCNRYNN